MSGFPLAGRRVLVTGASRGLGEALAIELAGRGAHVVLVARTAGALMALAERLGGTALPADLTDPAEYGGLVARAEEAAGPLDAVVNNAGLAPACGAVALPDDETERLFRLNVLAPISLCRQAVPRMLERGRGRIVNISSMAAMSPVPGLAYYAATKAALSQYSYGLHMELQGLPVGVTLVEVGPMPTDMLEELGAYEPTAASFDRLARLRIMPYTDRATVARATADAIERGRFRVRYPALGRLGSVVAAAPRIVAEVAITGLARRTDPA